MSGRLLAVAVAPRKRAAMIERVRARVSRDHGVEGDARGRRPGRQVTVVFQESWLAACAALGQELPWTARRANLLVAGLAVPDRIGAQLRIGPVVLEVTEETKPCGLMEKAVTGLKAALKPAWRGGVCCIVVEGGEIALGDTVALV